jgi:hypothetical protein
MWWSLAPTKSIRSRSLMLAQADRTDAQRADLCQYVDRGRLETLVARSQIYPANLGEWVVWVPMLFDRVFLLEALRVRSALGLMAVQSQVPYSAILSCWVEGPVGAEVMAHSDSSLLLALLAIRQ